MKNILLLIALHGVTALSVFAVDNGSLNFSYDENSGKKLLSYGKTALELKKVELTFDKPFDTSDFRRTSHHWDAEKQTLRETYESGALKLVDIFSFSALGLSRSVEISLPSTSTHPLKFKKITFPCQIMFSGKYCFPASESGNGALFDPEMKGDIPTGGKTFSLYHPNDSFAPLLLEAQNKSSWLLISDGKLDRCATGIEVKNGKVLALQTFAAAGWLEAGITQHAGSAEILFTAKTDDNTLQTLIRKWYAAKGYKPPADRSAWVADAIVYSCHPLGTLWSNLGDLGGFVPAEKELLPIIRGMGFNTIWLLPLEDAWIYWPRDYYKLNTKLEGKQAYRDFITAAKADNIHILQDIVPHGGSPSGGKLRGNSPFGLCFDEKGQVPSYWCFDFGNRKWQNYVAEVAAYYMNEYEIDGFRIDAVKGSKTLNWLRPGFPAQCPQGVDLQWWEQGLKDTPEAERKLNYPRASMAMRSGGLEMTDAIRAKVKEHKKNGIVLAETNSGLAVKHADIIYDTQFNHMTIPKLRTVHSGFAAGCMQLLREQLATDPPGLLRLRSVDNHDTTNLLGLYGLAPWKALHSYIFALPGVPMLYHDKEIFQEPFLTKLIELRKALPELSRGETSFPPITAPEVFCMLRTLGDKRCLILINFSSDARSVVLPALSGKKPWLRELLNGKTPEDSITLSPWQAAFVVIRESADVALAAISPLYGTATETPAVRTTAVSISADKQTISINASTYQAKISATNGMLLELYHGKKKVLGPGNFSRDNQTVLNLNTRVELKNKQILCSSDQLKWTWLPKADRLELQIDEARNGDEDLHLVFPVADARRWQVHCAEGLIDDIFHTRHRHGKPGMMPGYRLRGDNVVWNSELMPLSPAVPLIAAMTSHATVKFNFARYISATPTNLRVLDSFAGKNGWNLSLTLNEKSLNALFPRKPATKIALNISAVTTTLEGAHEEFRKLPLPGGLSLSHNGLEWIVKGKFGSLHLTRSGGIISRLIDPAGKTRLEQGMLYTSSGFGRKNATVSRSAYPHMDTESGMYGHMENSSLKLYFYGQLRDNGCWKAIEHPIWFVNEYRFDQDGSIGCRIAFNSEEKTRFPKCFLAWRGKIPEAESCSYDHADFVTINPSGKGRSNRSGSTMPRTITVKSGAGKIAFRDISVSGPALPETFFDSHNLFFAWSYESADQFTARQTYTLSLRIVVEK